MFKPKFFTVEFTYADEATPREPQYRTVKANSAEAAKEELLIRSALNGDRIYVGQAMTNS
jgi:hypothetical protein